MGHYFKRLNSHFISIELKFRPNSIYLCSTAFYRNGSSGSSGYYLLVYTILLQAIKEIRKLRKQLTSEINLSVANVDVTIDPSMKPPDDNQARLLRQLLLSGLGDQVGRKIGLDEVKEGKDSVLKKIVANLAQYFARIFSLLNEYFPVTYRSPTSEL